MLATAEDVLLKMLNGIIKINNVKDVESDQAIEEEEEHSLTIYDNKDL